MHIGVPLETQTGETRVAATPETIKKLIGQGHQVTVQRGQGSTPPFRTVPMRPWVLPWGPQPMHTAPNWS